MTEKEFARPQVVVSKCLGFEACRWNQVMIEDEFVNRLGRWVDYRPVCPEVETGLGVPRDPVRLITREGAVRLVQPATGVDWTGPMSDFMGGFFPSLGEVDGFLLKSRSPSCGPNEVKIYVGPEPGANSQQGSGMFAAQAKARYPAAAMEHEGRVKNFQLREHFLTKIFTLASFRATWEKGTMGGLVDFHAANKLLLMAYNQNRMRTMGRITANPGHQTPAQVLAAYGRELNQALARGPRKTSIINVLMHALGYFKKKLGSREKAHFLDTIELYRQGRVLLGTLQTLLYSWILGQGQEYLAGQTFFRPYPLELLDLADSGKGREIEA